MKGNLKHAIELTFGHEGGYVNHPKDPGGPTKFGITLGTLSAHRGRVCTAVDVKDLTLDEAAEILDKGYWRKVWGDDLPSGVDFAMFDFAVNSGAAQAVKSLQRVLGVTRDGSMGPRTLAAAKGRAPVILIRQLSEERLDFMRGLKTWPTFGKGWSRRVAEVKEAAIDMSTLDPAVVAGHTPAVAQLPEAAASAKPTETAVSSTKQGKVNIATIAAGAVAVGGLVPTLTPYASTAWVAHALPWLALIGGIGVIVTGVIGYKVTSGHIEGGSPQ